MPTVIPIVSSDTAGPLGAIHLPRLWTKLTLAAHGMLPADYDECGKGFDALTLATFNVEPQKAIDFVRGTHPSYMQFEQWIVEQSGGKVDAAAIAKHNANVRGYAFSDEKAATMRKALHIADPSINDAVRLNTVEDLDALHHSLHS